MARTANRKVPQAADGWDEPCSVERLPPILRKRDGRDLRPIYTPSETAAVERFDAFSNKWGQQYRAIFRLWRYAWSEFIPPESKRDQ
jgi:hypothetical protein